MSDDLIIKAAQFADECHRGQVRKYTGRPYIEHPGRVAARFTRHPGASSYGAAAAWLHDVVEDCSIDIETIRGLFGPVVASFVDGLTNPSKAHPQLKRAERKAMDRAHIAAECGVVQCIKLIDRADNLREMDGAPEDFISLYVKETELLLDALSTEYVTLRDELNGEINRLLTRTCKGTK